MTSVGQYDRPRPSWAMSPIWETSFGMSGVHSSGTSGCSSRIRWAAVDRDAVNRGAIENGIGGRNVPKRGLPVCALPKGCLYIFNVENLDTDCFPNINGEGGGARHKGR